MAIWNRMKKGAGDDAAVAAAVSRVGEVRRQTDVHIPTHVYGRKRRVLDVLGAFRHIWDVYEATDFIVENHPDATQAKRTSVTLANNGHKMAFFAADGSEDSGAADAWKKYAARATPTNTMGFDGIINQWLNALVKYGQYGFELTATRRGDVDFHIVLPQWLQWEMDKAGAWHPYQQQRHKRVDLLDGNFFWTVLNPLAGTPEGELPWESALMAIDRQLEFFQDAHQVLRKAGYPRNHVTIDRAAVLALMPAAYKQDPAKQKKFFDDVHAGVVRELNGIEPTSSFVTYDDVKPNIIGADNGRTIDLRAYTEMLDPHVLNGLGALGFLVNRPNGVTETWGSVQMKALILMLESWQRATKRSAEDYANFWARANGYNVTAKFTHNPIDWMAELDKLKVKELRQKIAVISEEKDWISKGAAAKQIEDVDSLPPSQHEGTAMYAKKIQTNANKKAETESEKS